jgi:hypothetical protein
LGWIWSGSFSTALWSIHLDFLGRPPFRRENPGSDVLDFLGFSRTNRDFSMGYEDKIGKIFSCRFWRRQSSRGPGLSSGGMADGQDLTWGELSLASDYRQHIVRELCRM